MFSADIQLKLRKNGFELTCAEENIWILEEGDQSVTISGEDLSIEAIWQTFDGEFEEFEVFDIDRVLEWSKKMLKK
jgi:hypothetical protein